MIDASLLIAGGQGPQGPAGPAGPTGATGPQGPAGTVSSNLKARLIALAANRIYQLTNAGNGNTETDYGSDAQNGTWAGTGIHQVRGVVIGDAANATYFDGSGGSLGIPTTGLPTGATAFSIGCFMEILAYPAFAFAWALGTVASHELVALDWSNSGIQADNNPSLPGVSWGGTVTTLAPNQEVRLWVVNYDGTNLSLWVNGRQLATAATAVNLTYGAAKIGVDVDGTTDPVTAVMEYWFLIKGSALTQAQQLDLLNAYHGN